MDDSFFRLSPKFPTTMLARSLCRPLSRPLSKGLVRSEGGALADIYVDSVNGSDSNDGLTAETALQTLAATTTAAQAFGNGVRVGIAAGSSWSGETLNISDPYSFPSPSNGKIIVYGGGGTVGDVVSIDCSKAASNAAFATNATYPATCRDIAWSHAMGSANTRITVFENGKQLVRRATLADCNANPGSFFGGNTVTAGVASTIVVHPYGTTDPATDGKEYRLTYVESAIRVSHGWEITGPFLIMRNGHNDGSLVCGINSKISRVLAYQGTKHNALVGSGEVRDSIALDAPFNENLVTGAGAATSWINYNAQSDPSGVRWVRSAAIQSAEYLAQRGVTRSDSSMIPWDAHANVAITNGNSWENCHATGFDSVFPTLSKVNVTSGFFSNCRMAFNLTGTGDIVVSGSIFKSMGVATMLGTAAGNITLSGCFFSAAKLIMGNTATGKSVVISQNIVDSLYSLTPRTAGAANWSVSYNVINDFEVLTSETNRATLGAWDEHHNLFAKGNRFTTPDGNYFTLAAYQAGVWGPGTGDAINLTLGFVQTPSISGNFQLTPGSAAANLLGADNSGRPSRWPTWPNSLADCKQFIANPDAWAF